MRIVLDTNVLVAGLLSATGPPAWIVEAVLAGELELALDMAIREEYEEVLRRPEFRFGAGHVEDLLAAIDQFAFLVTAAPPCPEPLPDPDDEPFLAVAAATGASWSPATSSTSLLEAAEASWCRRRASSSTACGSSARRASHRAGVSLTSTTPCRPTGGRRLSSVGPHFSPRFSSSGSTDGSLPRKRT